MKKRGLFITIEKTMDGLGGSTQVVRLAEALRTETLQTLGIETLREPGSTKVGEELRTILLNKETRLAPATELLLFNACRAQLYYEKLQPALEAGKIVICDRYFDSTIAYQGAGRGWSYEVLANLHDYATHSLFPDITFVLDGTPYRSRSREDRFESLDDAFFERVRDEMLKLAASDERYVLLNANQPPEIITEQMVRILKERFPRIFRAS